MTTPHATKLSRSHPIQDMQPELYINPIYTASCNEAYVTCIDMDMGRYEKHQMRYMKIRNIEKLENRTLFSVSNKTGYAFRLFLRSPEHRYVRYTIPVNIQPSQIRRFHAVHFWGVYCSILLSSNPGH